jgi:ribonuclease-3 family protein
MIENMLSDILGEAGSMTPAQIASLNPLSLAFIGDAVYEVFIRTFLLTEGPDRSVHKLHMQSTDYVKAHAQSDIVHRILPTLTDEEQDIIRKGRNSKSGYVPKNADVVEYRIATGFEALIGFLYLSGRISRLMEILARSVVKEE